MNIHTPTSHVVVRKTIKSRTFNAAATTNGAVIDTRGFDAALVILHVGTLERDSADETLAAKVQEGAASNLSDAADISGAAFTTIAAQTIDATEGYTLTMSINLKNGARKRYIRGVITIAGTIGGATTVAEMTVVLFAPHSKPTQQVVNTTVTTGATPVVIS